jgi:hypothetical protein
MMKRCYWTFFGLYKLQKKALVDRLKAEFKRAFTMEVNQLSKYIGELKSTITSLQEGQ